MNNTPSSNPPNLNHMTVLGATSEAVYLRLPLELQRPTDGCSCDRCRRNPALAMWDTLVVPLGPDQTTWTVHMPGTLAEAREQLEAVRASLARQDAERRERREDAERREDDVECALCGEAFRDHSDLVGNHPPACVGKGSRPGDRFIPRAGGTR